MGMCHKINKRRVGACIAAVVVAIASLLCSLPASASEHITSWWSTDAFPYAAGESTLTDVKDVHVFVARETLRHGNGPTVATSSPLSYAWYQCYEGADYYGYGYPSVYVRYGGEWVDVGHYYATDSTAEIGFDFQISFYDGDVCKDNDSDAAGNTLTYADHFQNVLTGTYANARTCNWGNKLVYAVRWTAKTGNITQKFCYIVVPHPEDDGVVTKAAHYIGNKIHPAQAAYWGNEASAAEYEGIIADLESDLEAAESERDAAIAERENVWEQAYDEGYAQGEYIGYDNGYRAGVAVGGDVDVDYIIDDTSVQSTVISFIAVCFRGVRDFFSPFFEIEFFGFKVFDMVTITVVGGLVVGVVLFVLKFIRG